MQFKFKKFDFQENLNGASMNIQINNPGIMKEPAKNVPHFTFFLIAFFLTKNVI